MTHNLHQQMYAFLPDKYNSHQQMYAYFPDKYNLLLI